MATDELVNAYSVLSCIHGLNSFSLDPSSSQEDIVKAFQTQSLLYHPDNNPGDPEASRIYERIKRAYETLGDPTSRAAHDSLIAASPARSAPDES